MRCKSSKCPSLQSLRFTLLCWDIRSCRRSYSCTARSSSRAAVPLAAADRSDSSLIRSSRAAASSQSSAVTAIV